MAAAATATAIVFLGITILSLPFGLSRREFPPRLCRRSVRPKKFLRRQSARRDRAPAGSLAPGLQTPVGVDALLGPRAADGAGRDRLAGLLDPPSRARSRPDRAGGVPSRATARAAGGTSRRPAAARGRRDRVGVRRR